MSTDSAQIFDAALGLPVELRADLAAQLIDSLDSPPLPDRTPEEWIEIIHARCESIDRGETELIDGEVVVAQLQAIIDRAGGTP